MEIQRNSLYIANRSLPLAPWVSHWAFCTSLAKLCNSYIFHQRNVFVFSDIDQYTLNSSAMWSVSILAIDSDIERVVNVLVPDIKLTIFFMSRPAIYVWPKTCSFYVAVQNCCVAMFVPDIWVFARRLIFASALCFNKSITISLCLLYHIYSSFPSMTKHM